jgi:hypothetical protein
MDNSVEKLIKASKGMVYTNGEVFANEIELAVSDSPDNWYQISVEEMKKIENEREEKPDEMQ